MANGHEAALRKLKALEIQNPKPGTLEGDRLDALAAIVEEFEKHDCPMPANECVTCNELDELHIAVETEMWP